MKLLSFVFILSCSANVQWKIRNIPESIVLEKATINGQEVYEINTILTGDFPSHTLSSEGNTHILWFVISHFHPVLKTFDPFSPIKKAVIILTSEHLPDSENQFQLQSTLSQPSIEVRPYNYIWLQ